MILSFASKQLLNVLFTHLFAQYVKLRGSVLSLCVNLLLTSRRLIVFFEGGETPEQQALAGCWHLDVEHSSGYEGHPQR